MKIEINVDTCTALHCASDRGYLDIAELLVSSGADMNIGSISGTTALHYASLRSLRYSPVIAYRGS